ncbi:MAG: dihydrolipoyllysine-residue acetyltransferase [Pseudomonadota bacterium]
MSKQNNVSIPDLGDFSDVEVIEVLVAVGDSVSAEDGIITLETDKATMDVPAPMDGTIASLSVAVGDTVNSGDIIAVLEQGSDAHSAPAADEPATDTPSEDDGDTVIRQVDAVATADSAQTVPDLGDFSDVEVIDVLVNVGDVIAVDDGLVTLETDKATMDVPSTAAGTITDVKVSVGDRVNIGDTLAIIAATLTADAAPVATAPPANEPDAPTAPHTEQAPVDPATATAPKPPTQIVEPTIDEAGFSTAHASPSVRRLARELGVNLARVKGTGRKGRISADDVKAWVKQTLAGHGSAGAGTGAPLPATPVVDFGAFGPIREEKLSRIQKISGPRLQASWINLPHVTQHDLADITELEARRQLLKGPAKDKGISLTPLAFIVRAVVRALAEFPTFASSLSADGSALVMKEYCHIGFAADTPNGLMVPVIRDADKLDVYEVAGELATLSKAAREGKLKLDQMQGAVFTISSLGGIGGTAFTPIVNAPEVAILGVSRSSMQPVWNGESFDPRLLLPLSLSYDHRVIDGAAAVRFTTRLGELLGDVAGLLEAQP